MSTYRLQCRPRLRGRLAAVGLAVVFGCLAAAASSWAIESAPPAAGAATAASADSDWRWLNRCLFGGDQESLARLRRMGRADFLREQLALPADDPAPVAAAVAKLRISQVTAEQQVRSAFAERVRLRSLPTEEEKQRVRVQLFQAANSAAREAAQRHLLRALYSPGQLREQMTWFWMNHFSVFSGKGQIRWTVADYEEHVIRPRALGRFSDLVKATVTSPAMLEYLDNDQNGANRINENYARELMELHTLGIAGGASGSDYREQDIRELARILTGLGVNMNGEPAKIAPDRQAQHVVGGLFEFNPQRHDYGQKRLLGRSIAGAGFGEVDEVVALLSRHPATARFISYKLAAYFVADTPPPSLVARMAETYARTDGDIAAILRTMFLSPELEGALAQPAGVSQARKFKDPMQYVASSLRLFYEGRQIANMPLVVEWLNQLGQPLYGRVSPDGYPAYEEAWASSGQMIKRFEIARAIGSGGGMFARPKGEPTEYAASYESLLNLYRMVIEPGLSTATKEALAQTATPAEWNATLLSSPEWMHR